MAFTRRVLAGLVTIVTVALGLSLAIAGPAAAATGVWRAYGNTNPITSSDSTWKCGSSEKIGIYTVAQVCAIRSPSGASVQSAVIVRNNSSSVSYAQVWVDLWTRDVQLNYWECPRSGVGGNSWSVCFGQTLAHRGSVQATASAQGDYTSSTSLPESPWI